MNQYRDWHYFRFMGRQFIGLERDGQVAIRGKQFANYGSWQSVASFKKHYALEGEGLRLETVR